MASVANVVWGDSADDWARMNSITPKGYVCYRATEPVSIDGRLDEMMWQSAPWTDDFSDIEGAVKPTPRFRTRAKMLWDAEYFYIAASLEEPHVWGSLKDHDAVIFHDNDFEVFIDPNGDNHEYYEFEINALNTGWDLFLPRPYKDGGKADNSWEIPGLKTAVHVQGTLNDASDRDQRWSVEIAFPWKSIRHAANRTTTPRDGDRWRVNFSRVEWRHDVVDGGKYRKMPRLREDNWVWSPQGIIDMHRPERWGLVLFSEATPGSVTLPVDPHHAARDTLMSVYHHQKAFHQKHKRWAANLNELTIDTIVPPDQRKRLVMTVTDDGFEASLDVASPGLPAQRLHVRHDSRLWLTSP
jgi:hypothetical protein